MATLEPKPTKKQQTNILLDIHRQTCVATFNSPCLSRLPATKGLFLINLFVVGDVNFT